jgi:hypothetical protein
MSAKSKQSEAYQKRERTMIEKFGSLEAYTKARKEWSRQGGLNAPGLMMFSPERRKEISQMGRDKSRKNLLEKYGVKETVDN